LGGEFNSPSKRKIIYIYIHRKSTKLKLPKWIPKTMHSFAQWSLFKKKEKKKKKKKGTGCFKQKKFQTSDIFFGFDFFWF